MDVKSVAVSVASMFAKAITFVFSIRPNPSIYLGMTGYVDYQEIYRLSGERCKHVVSKLLSD